MITLLCLIVGECLCVSVLEGERGVGFVYFCTKFQVSSIIVGSFRQRGEGGRVRGKKP